MSSNIRTSTSMTVVDLPGFQNPATCGRNSGATFEDLCYNYAQEKIQMLYHDLTFTLQQDRYSQVMERDWYLLGSLYTGCSADFTPRIRMYTNKVIC